jgi:hypothetical protein
MDSSAYGTCVAWVLLFALVFVPTEVLAEGAREITFNWHKGQKLRYEVLMKGEIATGSKRTPIQVKIGIENEILSVSADGTANIISTIIAESGSLGRRIASSASEREIVLKRVDRHGEIEYLSSGREAEELALLDLAFPRGALKIGDSWTRQALFPTEDTTLTLLATYKLEKVEECVADISVRTCSAALLEDGSLESNDCSSGNARFDVLKGILLELETKSKVPFVVSSTKQKGTLEIEISMKLVE